MPEIETVAVSIVIPLFNEAESLEPLLRQIEETMARMAMPYEVLFVDDGSTDGSFAVLERLRREHDRVKVIRFRRNFGKAAALSVGFREATGDLIVTMDADLEDDPAEIPKMRAKLDEGYDLVVGWRRHRLHSTFRKNLPSKLFNAATALVSGVRIHDMNCGLKMLRREVAVTLRLYGELHRYIPAMAHQEGYRVGEVEVQHYLRRFGKSKYGLGRFVKGMLDLVTVIFLNRYLRRPLHLFGSVGLAFSLLGLLINLYILSLRLRFGNIQSRHPLLWLGILLVVVGIQFISTGLLGEMITRSSPDEERMVRETRI